jgi:ABC-type Fe3+/spermidine/putrescine transport system ATPase subunit
VTRIAVMKDGILQQFGTPDDIYGCPPTLMWPDSLAHPP